MNRADALALMTEYTQGESLRKHMLAVEAAVRGYARAFGENEEEWGVVALLHDFDYERWPSREDHPYRGVEILKEKGYPEWVTARFCRTPTIRASRARPVSRRRCSRAMRWPDS